jgi:hypothetical protein
MIAMLAGRRVARRLSGHRLTLVSGLIAIGMVVKVALAA